MSTKRVKGEELAGFMAVAAGLSLTKEQDVPGQQAHLGPHIHPIHLLTHVNKLGFTWTNAHTHTHT